MPNELQQLVLQQWKRDKEASFQSISRRCWEASPMGTQKTSILEKIFSLFDLIPFKNENGHNYSLLERMQFRDDFISPIQFRVTNRDDFNDSYRFGPQVINIRGNDRSGNNIKACDIKLAIKNEDMLEETIRMKDLNVQKSKYDKEISKLKQQRAVIIKQQEMLKRLGVEEISQKELKVKQVLEVMESCQDKVAIARQINAIYSGEFHDEEDIPVYEDEERDPNEDLRREVRANLRAMIADPIQDLPPVPEAEDGFEF